MKSRFIAMAFALSNAFNASATDKNAAANIDPLDAYYANTLVCQNQVTKPTCRLWVNPDGKYFAFYDLGAQAKAPDINGPWQVNGREGTWTLRKTEGKYQLCLWIAAPRANIGAQQQREIYSEAQCYPFTAHRVGESWIEKDLAGRDVKFWLMEGRYGFASGVARITQRRWPYPRANVARSLG